MKRETRTHTERNRLFSWCVWPSFTRHNLFFTSDFFISRTNVVVCISTARVCICFVVDIWLSHWIYSRVAQHLNLLHIDTQFTEIPPNVFVFASVLDTHTHAHRLARASLNKYSNNNTNARSRHTHTRAQILAKRAANYIRIKFQSRWCVCAYGLSFNSVSRCELKEMKPNQRTFF